MQGAATNSPTRKARHVLARLSLPPRVLASLLRFFVSFAGVGGLVGVRDELLIR